MTKDPVVVCSPLEGDLLTERVLDYGWIGKVILCVVEQDERLIIQVNQLVCYV
jgi:hypothetical protein